MEYLRKVLPSSLVKPKILIKENSACRIYDEKDFTRIEYKDQKVGENAIKILKELKHPNILNLVKFQIDKSNTYIKVKRIDTFPPIQANKSEPEIFMFKYYTLNIIARVIKFLNEHNISHGKIEYESFFLDSNGQIVLGMFEYCEKIKNDNDEKKFLKLAQDLRKESRLQLLDHKSNKKRLDCSYIKKNKSNSNNSDQNIIEECNKLYQKLNDPSTLNEILDIFRYNKFDSVDDFIDKNEDIFLRSIYFRLEELFRHFNVLKKPIKEIYIDFIGQNSEYLIENVLEKLFDNYLLEITTEDKKYKEKILKVFFNKNLKCKIENRAVKLFSIPDTQVRLFLLQELGQNPEMLQKISNWNDKLFENILLGILCSDETLKMKSIKILDVIFPKLSDKNRKETIKSIYKYIKKDFQILEGIILIENNIEIFKKEENTSGMIKYTYSFILVAMDNDTTRNRAFLIFLEFYKKFDIIKLHREALPFIIGFLSAKNDQDMAFNIIEKILLHLKENKEALFATKWDVKNIRSSLSKLNIPFMKPKEENTPKSGFEIVEKNVDNTHKTEKILDYSDENEWIDEEW